MLSIFALVLVVAALLGETLPEGDITGKVAKWLKAHALNLAVAIDIIVAENKDAIEALHETGILGLFHAIPAWIWFVGSLIILSYCAKTAKSRKLARIAAAALTVAELAE